MIPRYIRNEELVSSKVNVVSHFDDETLLDKSDRLIKIIRLEGLDFVTRDDDSLQSYKAKLNNILKGFSSEFAWYVWDVRRKYKSEAGNSFNNFYAKKLNDRYIKNINSAGLYVNDIYVAIITKQPEGLFKGGLSFIQQFIEKYDQELRHQYLKRRYRELNDVVAKFMQAMKDYGCSILSVYEKRDKSFSAPLEFITQLLNSEKYSVPLVDADISTLLTRERLSFDSRQGLVRLKTANGGEKLAALISIKGYCPETYPGIFNELRSIHCEYTITQSFRFIDRNDAKRKMRDQQLEMEHAKDESVSQLNELDHVLDSAAGGAVGLGLHHLSVCIFADSKNELAANVSLVEAKLSDLDIACIREDVACECAFWAQLPANFGFILRSAPISTLNFAGFLILHNYLSGKPAGNYWGDAVTVFETIAGTPYYFNFHYKDVGNFQVFGAMGSGKTALIAFLIAQSTKFGGKRVVFDKDRGLEIFVRAMGGVYEQIKPGMKTGFNPCQLDDTTENRAFLVQLFKRMLSTDNEVLSAGDMDVILSAVGGIFLLPKSDRQLCNIASYFGRREVGSLRNRFDQWHGSGEHAWLFDNHDDSLSLNADVLGFDLGALFNQLETKTPALMYLTHRVEQALIGCRGMLFCDEGWSMLNDVYFRRLIDNWSRTTRKLNNIFGIATQVANDTAHSKVSKAINESSFCKIFFANPSADEAIYRENYGLTNREIAIIKTLADDQHFFLLVHGHGENRKSTIVRPVLNGMHDDLLILSGRESSLLVLDQVRSELGECPEVIIPEFLSRMRCA